MNTSKYVGWKLKSFNCIVANLVKSMSTYVFLNIFKVMCKARCKVNLNIICSYCFSSIQFFLHHNLERNIIQTDFIILLWNVVTRECGWWLSMQGVNRFFLQFWRQFAMVTVVSVCCRWHQRQGYLPAPEIENRGCSERLEN